MKSAWLGVLVLCACEKPNDLPALQGEATSIAHYYDARLDELGNRLGTLVRRAPRQLTPDVLPVFAEATKLIRDDYELVGTVGGGKVKLERDAEELAKAGKVDDLETLLDVTHEKLESDVRTILNDLSTLDAWVARSTP